MLRVPRAVMGRASCSAALLCALLLLLLPLLRTTRALGPRISVPLGELLWGAAEGGERWWPRQRSG